MKILFFIDSLRSGGKERRLTELMKVLVQQENIEFELVVMSEELHYKEILNLGIKIHYLIRKTKKDISVFSKFYKLCKSYKPDIVHCWDSMTAIYCIPACKLLHIKLINGQITDTLGNLNISNKPRIRSLLTFPLSDLVIGNSQNGLEIYKAPVNKSVCIYNGFNFGRVDNIASNETIRKQLQIDTTYLIGMVASFSENKDYKTYFNAAHLLLQKRNDITFLAIGDKTDSEYCKKIVNTGYNKNFRFLGSRSDVESLINAMDICVLSTFTEGISNSILEYMALAKPVIATSGGGTNEIVQDQLSGFLINQSNPTELAEKAEILLNDSEMRNRMGKYGSERIRNNFSIVAMVSQYIIEYQKILINHKKD
jgi:glycosyltransferase involved in cell wall biosynthesis